MMRCPFLSDPLCVDGKLLGGSFYTVNDNPLCDKCFEKTLDICAGCGKPVKDKVRSSVPSSWYVNPPTVRLFQVLKALGQSFHPQCFGCTSCKKSLEGIQFTVDSDNAPHCMHCYRE